MNQPIKQEDLPLLLLETITDYQRLSEEAKPDNHEHLVDYNGRRPCPRCEEIDEILPAVVARFGFQLAAFIKGEIA
jgi:hypothetical protein